MPQGCSVTSGMERKGDGVWVLGVGDWRQRVEGAIAVSLAGLILAVWGLIGVSVVFSCRSAGAAKVARAKADLTVLREAVESFRADMGRYPTQDEGLSILDRLPTDRSLPRWHGPYLADDFPSSIDDPWGAPYLYRRVLARGKAAFIVESYGADGKPGGDGDDADIVAGSE